MAKYELGGMIAAGDLTVIDAETPRVTLITTVHTAGDGGMGTLTVENERRDAEIMEVQEEAEALARMVPTLTRIIITTNPVGAIRSDYDVVNWLSLLHTMLQC